MSDKQLPEGSSLKVDRAPGFLRKYRLPLFLAVLALCLYAGSIVYILLVRGAGGVSEPQAIASGGKSHTRVAGKMLLLACAMFGFGYLMVPLYDIICEVTGLNGKTGRVSVSSVADASEAVDREITVEFTASVNQSGSWIFQPDVKTMIVKPGNLYHASYYAENLSNSAVVAQATPSVTPFTAAKYFNKTECFCFTRQAFEAKGSMHMPLTFIIDPDIPINIDRITLSYTFFRSPDQS